MQLRSKRTELKNTSELCIDLFYKIGATNVTINDIDIAHRIPNRRGNNSTAPPAIICKFTRRLARESVMSRKKYTNNVTDQDLKIWPASQIKVSIFDHLTPRQQELLHECKTFQRDHGYKFCWVKKSVIYLRNAEGDDAIRITSRDDLSVLNCKVYTPYLYLLQN